MRILAAFLVALFLIAPGVVADDATILHEGCPETSVDEHNECHEEQDTPGLGVVASVGLLGAVAFLARRRSG